MDTDKHVFISYSLTVRAFFEAKNDLYSPLWG